jgi:hypothetical protein
VAASINGNAGDFFSTPAPAPPAAVSSTPKPASVSEDLRNLTAYLLWEQAGSPAGGRYGPAAQVRPLARPTRTEHAHEYALSGPMCEKAKSEGWSQDHGSVVARNTSLLLNQR